jgi:thiol:disulfide interchange protein DsbA
MIDTTSSKTRRHAGSIPAVLRAALLAAVSLVACSAFAQGALKEGVNYTVVKPTQSTNAAAGKVEVIEFFGYWCPHCNEFEPTMTDWAKRNEGKVTMSYVPIAFNASMANLQKLYYTLDIMGREKELRRKVFSSIHADRSLPPNADAGAIADWAEKNGIDKKKFLDTFNSFSVESKVNRANQMAGAYGVTAVPELGIAGKYLVNVDARSIGNADVLLSRALTEK